MTYRARRRLPIALLLALAGLAAALLAGAGETVTTTSLDQLTLYLDGAYRIAAGHVPNREFQSAFGPLTFYIPGAGYLLSGSLGAALPVGMALAVLALAPALTYVLVSRLQPILALSFGAFLILVLAAPLNLGDPVTSLSFSRFYNRIGWAALAALLVMYLPARPQEPLRPVADAVAAAFLALVMMYTKATYGLVALVFLGGLALDRRHRSWASGAILLTLVVAAILELFWGSSAAYLAELSRALAVSGAVRGSWGQIIDHVLGNLADYTLLGLLAGFALRQTRSWRDGLFYGFCAVSGFLVINQNLQTWGILTIHAAAAVATETLLRHPADLQPTEDRPGWSVQSGVALVFLALVLPTVAHCALALGLHAGASAVRAGETLSVSGLERVRLVDLWSPSEHQTARTYLTSVEDGLAGLQGLDQKPGPIAVLGPANPFSAALGIDPARGNSPWLLWGRNVDSRHSVAPGALLGGAETVMVPRAADPAAPGGEGGTASAEALEGLYGQYLSAEFRLVRTSEHWAIYQRKPGRISQFSAERD